MTEPFRVLFVCMGNICRSPAAEGIFSAKVESAGLSGRLQIDSAGTGGWHAGNLADPRMRRAAARRNYDLTSIARQVTLADFEAFDLILAMDRDNLNDLRSLRKRSPGTAELRLFCEFCTDRDESEVPDPYYGGDAGFENVLDLLENGCEGLIRHIRQYLEAR